MESKYHVGTRSTLRCKVKRKQRPPAVGRYLCALTKPRGDAALESGLAAAVGRVLCAEALTPRNSRRSSAARMGTAVEQCCAKNRKVADSIPAGVSGFFIDIKSFRSHYGPAIDSASNRNEYQEYLLGVKAAGA